MKKLIITLTFLTFLNYSNAQLGNWYRENKILLWDNRVVYSYANYLFRQNSVNMYGVNPFEYDFYENVNFDKERIIKNRIKKATIYTKKVPYNKNTKIELKEAFDVEIDSTFEITFIKEFDTLGRVIYEELFYNDSLYKYRDGYKARFLYNSDTIIFRQEFCLGIQDFYFYKNQVEKIKYISCTDTNIVDSIFWDLYVFNKIRKNLYPTTFVADDSIPHISYPWDHHITNKNNLELYEITKNEIIKYKTFLDIKKEFIKYKIDTLIEIENQRYKVKSKIITKCDTNKYIKLYFYNKKNQVYRILCTYYDYFDPWRFSYIDEQPSDIFIKYNKNGEIKKIVKNKYYSKAIQKRKKTKKTEKITENEKNYDENNKIDYLKKISKNYVFEYLKKREIHFFWGRDKKKKPQKLKIFYSYNSITKYFDKNRDLPLMRLDYNTYYDEDYYLIDIIKYEYY